MRARRAVDGVDARDTGRRLPAAVLDGASTSRQPSRCRARSRNVTLLEPASAHHRFHRPRRTARQWKKWERTEGVPSNALLYRHLHAYRIRDQSLRCIGAPFALNSTSSTLASATAGRRVAGQGGAQALPHSALHMQTARNLAPGATTVPSDGAAMGRLQRCRLRPTWCLVGSNGRTVQLPGSPVALSGLSR